MANLWNVRGGVGPPLAGIVRPDRFEGRTEWVPVRAGQDLMDVLRARLGSEVDVDRVILAVVCPLRAALEGPPLGALLARLPLYLAREVATGEQALAAHVPSPRGAGDYLVEAARLMLHPPAHAARYVEATFAAARAVLPREDADAIAARLPPELADLWNGAT